MTIEKNVIITYSKTSKGTNVSANILPAMIEEKMLHMAGWFSFTKGGFLYLLIVIFSEILGQNHNHSQWWGKL